MNHIFNFVLKSTAFFLMALLFVLCFKTTQAQSRDDLRYYEDSLKAIAPTILYGTHDFHKYEANEIFSDLLWDVLHYDNSFRYPFDSLTTISILTAPDNKFRIFTWNLQKSDGSYDFFGMIQLNPRRANGDLVYALHNEKNKPAKQAMNLVLSVDEWYGAHYYKIVPVRHRTKRYYTLLGWDGNNMLTTRKIVDVITFNEFGHPEFGAPVFRTRQGLKKRYIIEYANHVAASLKYERHYLYDGKNRTWMIVFDRVTPLTPMLEGQYQFYVPETNIFDAFVFQNGLWQLYEDVDARTDLRQRSRFRDPGRFAPIFW